MQTEHQASVAIYMRTSNESDENEHHQMLKLAEAAKTFTQSPDYFLNGSWWFMEELTIDTDFGKSGDTLNDGLKRFLDQLGYGDVVLMQNVKRMSRMDTSDDEFNYLVQRLFSDDRTVYTLSENTNEVVTTPTQITKEQFIEYASLSLAEYNYLRGLAKYGREVKDNAKEELLKRTLNMVKGGFSNKVIGMQLDKSISTITRYKIELRNRGELPEYVPK